jgi:hypothetical protein
MVQKTKLEMSTDHRMGAFLMLWESQIDGRPACGAAGRLAIQFDVDVLTINRLWCGTKNEIDARLNVVQNGASIDNHAIHALINTVNFYESGRKLSGLKPKWDVKESQEVVRGMPLTDRQTFSQLARNLLVPCSTTIQFSVNGLLSRVFAITIHSSQVGFCFVCVSPKWLSEGPGFEFQSAINSAN